MKKKVIINMIVLSVLMSFIGLIAIGIGAIKNKNYNENSIICTAVIIDIKTSSSVDDAYTSYHHRYYGQYVVEGKTYTDIEVLKTETDTKTPEYSIGQTIKVRVIKDNPSKIAEKGTTPYIVGFVSFGCVILIMLLSLFIYKHIREPENKAE